MSKIRGIKYIGPVQDNSGYAKAARGYVLALNKLGVPITLSPVTFEDVKPDLGEDGEVIKSLINKDVDYNVVLIHTTPEFWPKHLEKGKLNIGYTIWETTKLHPDWPLYINNTVDKVLVGCEWNIDVFKDSGVTIPIASVPHAIPIDDVDKAVKYDIEGVDDDTFVFYNISQWTERKDPLSLIKAYWHEFNEDDNVALVLKTYRSNYSKQEKDAIRMTIRRVKEVTVLDYYPPIHYISNMLSEDEIRGLHVRGNCYVAFDRGEGFGIPAFTAGAYGKPVIATGFGGALEYLKPENSYLINYILTPVSGMPWTVWYRGDQLWAQSDVKHGATLMREVYENYNQAKDKGKLLQKYISDNFNDEVIGRRMLNEIEVML